MVEYMNKTVQYPTDFLGYQLQLSFSVGHFVRGVTALTGWYWCHFGWIGSVVFISMGVLVSLLPSAQLMTVVGNIAYIALAVLGGPWFPLTLPRMV